MSTHMLSTVDNPWNPFTHWYEWFQYDEQAGWCSSGYVARVVVSSEELSEADQDLAITTAINEIIEYDPLGVYIRVRNPNLPAEVEAV